MITRRVRPRSHGFRWKYLGCLHERDGSCIFWTRSTMSLSIFNFECDRQESAIFKSPSFLDTRMFGNPRALEKRRRGSPCIIYFVGSDRMISKSKCGSGYGGEERPHAEPCYVIKHSFGALHAKCRRCCFGPTDHDMESPQAESSYHRLDVVFGCLHGKKRVAFSNPTDNMERPHAKS